MKDELRFRAVGLLGQGLMGGLFTTVRFDVIDADHYLRFRRQGQPVLFVFWHGYLLPLAWLHRHQGIVVLVSEHADGEYITRVLERQGFGTARGSSSRGGIKGLKGLIRAAREGHDLGISPDGPRGPARVFKPGALLAAQVAGLPIIPIAVGAGAGWRFRSWDRFLVPRPFSTLRVAYGEPVLIPRDADREQIDATATELAGVLEALTARAEGRGGTGAPGGTP